MIHHPRPGLSTAPALKDIARQDGITIRQTTWRAPIHGAWELGAGVSPRCL